MTVTEELRRSVEDALAEINEQQGHDFNSALAFCLSQLGIEVSVQHNHPSTGVETTLRVTDARGDTAVCTVMRQVRI